MKHFKILLIGAFFSIFVQSVFAAETLETSVKLPLTAQLQKETLPWFAARNSDDKAFTRKDLEAMITPNTKRVVLAFFATWCIPCREGVVRLRDNQENLDKNGVLVILVNAGETDQAKINGWVKEYGNDKWTLILDKFKQVQEKTGLIYGTETEIAFPKTILLDNKLKPMLLIGAEGKDFPQILWE